MRSIRLSLIFYFLLLLAPALGGVSYFCYQSTQEALAAKEVSTRKLWEKQFQDNSNRVRADFDAKLAVKARALGNKAVLYQHRLETLNIFGALAYGTSHGGVLDLLLPFAEAHPRIGMGVTRLRPLDVRIQGLSPDEEYGPSVLIIDDGEYFQTYALPPSRPFGSPPGKGEGPGKAPPPPNLPPPVKQEPYTVESSDTLAGVVWQL